MPSSTSAAQGRKSASCVVERRYWARFIIGSDSQIAGDAQMPADDVDELRVALGRPHGGGLGEDPKQETSKPQQQTEAERRRQRAIEDRDRARRTTQQDRFGQRAMHRDRETRDGIGFI